MRRCQNTKNKAMFYCSHGNLLRGVKAILEYYENRSPPPNISQIPDSEKEAIFENFKKGFRSNILRSTLFFEFSKLCKRELEPSGLMDFKGLLEWHHKESGLYERDQGDKESRLYKREQAGPSKTYSEASSFKNTIGTKINKGNKGLENDRRLFPSPRPKVLGNIKKPRVGVFIKPASPGFYAESWKFHFVNYNDSKRAKSVMNGARKIVLENGGVFVEEKDIDELQNLDTVVINFGEFNQVILDFLKKHQQDHYTPDLIMAAMGNCEMELNDSFLSVDRLEFILGNHRDDCGGGLREFRYATLHRCTQTEETAFRSTGDSARFDVIENFPHLPQDKAGNSKVSAKVLCKDFEVDVIVSSRDTDFSKCFAASYKQADTYKVYAIKKMFVLYEHLEEAKGGVSVCFEQFSDSIKDKTDWKEFYPVSKLKNEIKRYFDKNVSAGNVTGAQAIRLIFPDITTEFLDLIEIFVKARSALLESKN